MDYRRIQVEPIATALGAEVRGVDLSQALDEETESEIHAAWMEHLVLFFRDQEVTPAQHKSFAQRFGELHVHPVLPSRGEEGHPEIVVLESGANAPFVAEKWHSDVTFERRPPLGSVLRGAIIPEHGGDTLWSSMYAAYEALSSGMQRLLSDLRAVHDGGRFQAVATEEQKRELNKNVRATHPVIRTHPTQGSLCECVVHAENRWHEDVRERPVAALPLRPCCLARLHLSLPLAAELNRDVGQSLHTAPSRRRQSPRPQTHGARDYLWRRAVLSPSYRLPDPFVVACWLVDV